jgi:hypothetical protein
MCAGQFPRSAGGPRKGIAPMANDLRGEIRLPGLGPLLNWPMPGRRAWNRVDVSALGGAYRRVKSVSAYRWNGRTINGELRVDTDGT